MRPAAERLRERLAALTVDTPKIPVLHNVDVAEASDPEHIRDKLAQQLFSPVRWVETIQALAGRGISDLIEVGPGKVLSGLNKRIDKKLNSLAVFDPDGLSAALEASK
jgi:[acyl-carrier-protein] S-malonyltransferase